VSLGDSLHSSKWVWYTRSVRKIEKNCQAVVWVHRIQLMGFQRPIKQSVSFNRCTFTSHKRDVSRCKRLTHLIQKEAEIHSVKRYSLSRDVMLFAVLQQRRSLLNFRKQEWFYLQPVRECGVFSLWVRTKTLANMHLSAAEQRSVSVCLTLCSCGLWCYGESQMGEV